MSRHLLAGLLAALLIIAVPGVGEAAPADRCAKDSPGQPKNTCTATLVYVNDAHDVRPVIDDGQDRGGVARLATVINTVREQNPYTSVSFGGDLGGGTLFGGIYHGFPVVEALNMIGFDLANFGQHDFDFGVPNTRELVEASDFPWISSNLVDDSGAPFSGRPWAVEQVGAFSVGYLGLTDAMDSTGADAGVDQQPVIASARTAVLQLTAEADPDVIVALTQQGPDENRQLLSAVDGIDLVLTEEMVEDESVLTRTDDGAWIAAPEGNIGSVIKVDISRHGNRTSISPTVLEVDDTVTPDPELQQLEDHYAADLEERLGEQIATVATPLLLTDDAHRTQETTLGNLVADAFRSGGSFADGRPTDIGWIQGGGLRADVPGGDFTLESGYSVLPFGNKVIKVDVTGAQLTDALEQGLAGYHELGGGFPHVSGMSYAFDPSRPIGSRVTSAAVGNAPLDQDAQYTVAITDYVHDGGDGVTAFGDGELLTDPATAPLDADVLNGFARELGIIDYDLEGRITRVG